MESNLGQAVLSRIVRSAAETDPDRLTLVFENGSFSPETVTAGELASRGNQLANWILQAGLRSGDRVAVMMRNHPEFVYGLVANAQLALPTVPIDPRARGDKLLYFLKFADCSALLVADYVLADPTVADVVRRAGVKTWVVSTAEGRADGLDLSGEWAVVNEIFHGAAAPDAGEQVEDLATPWLLAYTSGTTGDPKAIEFGYERTMLYRRLPGFFGYRKDDVPYTGLSLTHGNALVVTLLPALTGDVDHSVFSRGFTKRRLWDVCAEHNVTTWSNLGGIATAVYSQPATAGDGEHNVRLVLSAGMPREIWRPFEERFGVRVLEWYGTMEGGFAYNPVGVGPVGSFGKPPEGLVDMDVQDENGQTVAPRTVGELVVRPAGGEARLSYYNNGEASAQKIRNGWLRTGDMVTRDENGYYFFAHRREEGGLRKAGEFISEGFIRRVLAEDPDVRDVHIYGIPARTGAPGETDVVAALVLRDLAPAVVERIFDRCAARLERSHIPDYLQVVADLPRTASEKVQSRHLIAQFDPESPNVFARTAVVA